MKWQPKSCEAGDMIRVRLGFIYHYGVFVSEDEVIQFGYPPLPEYAEKNDPVSVTAVDIDVFSCGKIIEAACLDRRERKKRIPPEKTVRLARERLGEEGYNIIHNNCEHFAYECVFGEKRSTQEEYIRSFWKDKLADSKR